MVQLQKKGCHQKDFKHDVHNTYIFVTDLVKSSSIITIIFFLTLIDKVESLSSFWSNCGELYGDLVS